MYNLKWRLLESAALQHGRLEVMVKGYHTYQNVWTVAVGKNCHAKMSKLTLSQAEFEFLCLLDVSVLRKVEPLSWFWI